MVRFDGAAARPLIAVTLVLLLGQLPSGSPSDDYTWTTTSSSSGGGGGVANEEGGRRRDFILHVGPGKTGTTAIQRALIAKQTELRADGYTYLGDRSNAFGPLLKVKGGWMSDDLVDLLCMRNTSKYFEPEELGAIGVCEFLPFPNGRYKQRWVDLTGADPNNECYERDGGGSWDVRVVVTYRRVFEMMPSRYNQVFKIKRYDDIKQKYHRDWPGINSDYRIPTLPEHIKAEMEGTLEIFTGWDWAQQSYPNWREAFPVSLFNYHQKGDMINNYFCHLLPGTETCRLVTEEFREGDGRRRLGGTVNPSTRYVDHDILAVHAHEMGLVHESDERLPLAFDVGKFWDTLVAENGGEEIGNPSLPVVCPDQSALDFIYEESKKSEAWAFGVLAAQQGTSLGAVTEGSTDFDENWRSYMDAEKYCSIDAPAALQLDEWQDYFRRRRETFEKL